VVFIIWCRLVVWCGLVSLCGVCVWCVYVICMYVWCVVCGIYKCVCLCVVHSEEAFRTSFDMLWSELREEVQRSEEWLQDKTGG